MVSPLPTRVIEVTDAELPRVRAFLEARLETSLFLLNNLRAFGPRGGESPYSGDFRALIKAGEIVAVWCAARNGSVVLQADGRLAFARVIADDIVAEGNAVTGVLGDWAVGAALWEILRDRCGLVTTQQSREVLYRLFLTSGQPVAPPDSVDVRTLEPSDAAAWDPLAEAFLVEQSLPVDTSRGRRAGFAASAAKGHWWGAWEGDRLVSIASFNAFYHPVAQVGGVYTVPDRRRCGLSRAVMQALLRDADRVHAVTRVVLFTGERQQAARALYESLGFEPIGAFGLFFGEPANRPPTPRP